MKRNYILILLISLILIAALVFITIKLVVDDPTQPIDHTGAHSLPPQETTVNGEKETETTETIANEELEWELTQWDVPIQELGEAITYSFFHMNDGIAYFLLTDMETDGRSWIGPYDTKTETWLPEIPVEKAPQNPIGVGEQLFWIELNFKQPNQFTWALQCYHVGQNQIETIRTGLYDPYLSIPRLSGHRTILSWNELETSTNENRNTIMIYNVRSGKIQQLPMLGPVAQSIDERRFSYVTALASGVLVEAEPRNLNTESQEVHLYYFPYHGGQAQELLDNLSGIANYTLNESWFLYSTESHIIARSHHAPGKELLFPTESEQPALALQLINPNHFLYFQRGNLMLGNLVTGETEAFEPALMIDPAIIQIDGKYYLTGMGEEQLILYEIQFH